MYAIGLDISADFFTAGCVNAFFETIFFNKNFDQTESGWQAFVEFLSTQGIDKTNCRVCMESTGVYSEKICYYLYNAGFSVFVEPPNKIKQSFYDNEKDDPIDARQIAEFVFRYPDKRHVWQPRKEIVYQLDSLLATREQLVRLRTACKNTHKSLKRKQHRQTKLEELMAGIADDLKLTNEPTEEENALFKRYMRESRQAATGDLRKIVEGLLIPYLTINEQYRDFGRSRVIVPSESLVQYYQKRSEDVPKFLSPAGHLLKDQPGVHLYQLPHDAEKQGKSKDVVLLTEDEGKTIV